MAIFKTSNSSPSSAEIDVTLENIFTSQVNTSGEPAKAYKLTILSGDASETIYDGPIQKLATPVKNKSFLEITGVGNGMFQKIPSGVAYYSDTTLTNLVGYTPSACEYTHTSGDDYASIVVPSATGTFYVPVPKYEGKSLSNGNDYQWGVRVYNVVPEATTQPNTTVCEGYLVGSTKYVTWMKLPKHGDESQAFAETGTAYYEDTACETYVDTLTEQTDVVLEPAHLYASFVLGDTTYYVKPDEVTTYKSIADNIKYDRYIEFVANSADDLIIGGHEPDDKVKPTNYPYTQRKKIDWVTKEIGLNKDYIKIETEKEFDYDYPDNFNFGIYLCSSDHTVNSAFVDPNSNINVANFILLYTSADKAKAALQAGENPETEGLTAVYPSRKITGYSSDTGEIRVNDPWPAAPMNNYAYRIFEQDVETKLYKELFTSDLVFTANYQTSGIKAYRTIILASSDSKVTYYNDSGLTQSAGQLSTNTSCSFVNSTYSTITKAGILYYVASVEGPTLAANYKASNVNGNCGIIYIDSTPYAVPFAKLSMSINNVSVDNPYSYQLVGGMPVLAPIDCFKTVSNRWDNSAHRLFVQPNINIKTDDTNPNEIVFKNGSRVNIIKQTQINPVNNKEVDTTFEKLDSSQWLLEGDSMSLETPSILPPTIPQTDYKVYTDFMDSAPLNLIYARKAEELTLQCKNYYKSVYQTISFTNPYYVPQGVRYYKDSSFTDWAAGDEIYIPGNTRYFSDSALTDLVGVTTASETYTGIIGGPGPQYTSMVYTSFTKNDTTYYVSTPTRTTTVDHPCEWSSGTTSVAITEHGETFYVPTASVRENPFIYMNMPSKLYSSYDYREIAFNTVISYGNDNSSHPQVKYYKYTLYDDSGVVIAESEDIYSIDIEWYFRGFESGKDKDNAKKYTIKVLIVDEYNAEFTKSEDFKIYYQTEHSLVPMNLKYDCHEHGMKIEVMDVLSVCSTDYEDQTVTPAEKYSTITENDLVYDPDKGTVKYLNVPDGKILNYTSKNKESFEPIFIPATCSLLTRFKIKGDLIQSIPNAGRMKVLSLGHQFSSSEMTTMLNNIKNLYNTSTNNNIKFGDLRSQSTYTPSGYPPTLLEPYKTILTIGTTEEPVSILVQMNRIYGQNQIYNDTEMATYLSTIMSGHTVLYIEDLIKLDDKTIEGSVGKSLIFRAIANTITPQEADTYANNLKKAIDEHRYLLDNSNIETYTMYITDINTYYYDDQQHKYIVNPKPGYLEFYKNNLINPVTAFNVNGTLMDYYDIEANCGPEYVSQKKLKYALQSQNKYQIRTTNLPDPKDVQQGVNYVLLNDTPTRTAGIYIYNSSAKIWEQNITEDFIVVQNDNELPNEVQPEGFISDSVGAVYNAQTGDYYWVDDDGDTSNPVYNVYIINNHATIDANIEQFENSWFTVFLKLDSTNTDETKRINCTIPKPEVEE